MASSSSAVRLFTRDGKSSASLLLRARTAILTETVQKSGSAIRSLLRFNQIPASQYPVCSEIFPVMQSGFGVGLFQQEAMTERREKMEAAHGKRVVDSDSELETDLDDEDIDDIDMDDDEDFDDSDDDDDDEEEEDDVSTRKKKK